MERRAQMMWNEFLEKLKQAKKEKKDKKVSVPVLGNLIFSGAFDSMIEGKPCLDIYKKMFEDIKLVKKSIAQLPPKTKDEYIGLKDVDNEIKLGFWRSQKCPIFNSIPIEDYFEKPLLSYGFVRMKRKDSNITFYKEATGDKPVVYATTSWNQLISNPKTTEYFQGCHILIYGMIESAEVRKFGAGKEMMVIKMFNGREITSDFVLWPKWGESKLSASYKDEIKRGELYSIIVKLGTYKGRINGTVVSAIRFSHFM